MRDIEAIVCGAFVVRRPKAKDNTHTDGTTLYLHGNAIAQWRGTELWFSLAGWPTPTTRSRLNAVCESLNLGRPFYQDKGRQYVGNNAVGPCEIEPAEWYRLHILDADLAEGERPKCWPGTEV